MGKASLSELLAAPGLDPQLRAIALAMGRLTTQVSQLQLAHLDLEAGDERLRHVVSDSDWHELAGLDGVFLKALPELGHGPHGTYDYMAVHGLQGARGPNMRNPRRQRVHVRRGSILFSRNGGPYLPYHAGESIAFDYGERHAFIITAEFYAIAEYEPRLTPTRDSSPPLPPAAHFTPNAPHAPTS